MRFVHIKNTIGKYKTNTEDKDCYSITRVRVHNLDFKLQLYVSLLI